jgi:hypothetical protein
MLCFRDRISGLANVSVKGIGENGEYDGQAVAGQIF